MAAVPTLPAATRAAELALTGQTNEFIETAAAISAVDVVVTVDTAVAYVAGAPGRTTFLLLPHRADWRRGDPDTPSRWYPSCRVFRQPSPGAWGPVVRQVADALRPLAGARIPSSDRVVSLPVTAAGHHPA